MIKVCVLTSVHPPFDIRIFHKEAKSLYKAGYDVALIAQHDKDEIVEGIKILSLPKPRSRIERMTKTVWQVYRKALKIDADIYHFHDPELLTVGILLKMQDKKVIYDIHEDLPRAILADSRDYFPKKIKKPVSWILERVENFFAAYFIALIAATPAIGQRLQAINTNTEIINNFPIADELMASKKAVWEARSPAVAYVGNISLGRGLRVMVEAMSYIPNNLNVRLKLAGDFFLPKNSNDVFQLPGWEKIDKLGFLNRNEVTSLLSYIQAGLVLFLPEPNHIEAQPNKLFEYMSAGIPVIASDFPLWRKIVEGSQCGILVDPLNPKDIAAAIEYILTHPVEAETMGNKGKQAVENYYNWDLEKNKLLQLYAILLDNH